MCIRDSLGRRLADQHAVVAPDVVDDRFVELVAADADAALVDHAAQADDPAWLGDVLFLQIMQVGSAGEQSRVPPGVFQEAHRLFGGAWPIVGEVLHGCPMSWRRFVTGADVRVSALLSVSNR